MEEEELETYVEVPTEDDYEEYEDDAFGDMIYISFIALLLCAVFAFGVKTVSKHLKNVKFKVGDKIEIGIESKEKEEKK